ncbi:hypothetical protein BCV72DRAFT_295375 [Rhizopus microsporus var. microsporus]|uniref:NmrA-like domain-containing protein n=2 Tax=Rhizopus microsporus TaxID=58291 RepID=A0A2G4STE3_RHIZD|nr:uncharacterized protein RHIMIDRAFT_313585 [Rhizopus microsporus ATCC 52813]ORE04028.1 hypothetical protein BCV72DRAFT_295375 [Rhizopus microsporus var. microsporus]PHZ12057.1 hypothetical protein RHIMIDRAFT_313585 [Rhizopus microsporus ATCC 52813]
MKTRVITNGDSLLGFATAYKFLTEDKEYKYRILCCERQGLDELALLGADVVEVDYMNEIEVCRLLRDTCYVMLVPEFSKPRREEAESVMRCAQKEHVDYMTLFSVIGVDAVKKEDNRLEELKDYRYLEDLIPKYFSKDNYCIMRLPLFHQFFFYMGPLMEDENKIRLPVSEHAQWCAIDMEDALDAIVQLSNVVKGKKNKTLFNFTPSQHNYDVKDVVSAANKALDRDMTFEKSSRSSMRGYLKDLRDDNRFRERPSESHGMFPLGRYLNETNINTILDYWELSEAKHTDVISQDLEDAIGRSPTSLKDFFHHNREQFKRLR